MFKEQIVDSTHGAGRAFDILCVDHLRTKPPGNALHCSVQHRQTNGSSEPSVTALTFTGGANDVCSLPSYLTPEDSFLSAEQQRSLAPPRLRLTVGYTLISCEKCIGIYLLSLSLDALVSSERCICLLAVKQTFSWLFVLVKYSTVVVKTNNVHLYVNA